MVKKELLDMIRCPHCMQQEDNEGKGKLKLYKECWLLCDDCERKYPIIEDIPVLLLEEAEKWLGVTKEELSIPPKKTNST